MYIYIYVYILRHPPLRPHETLSHELVSCALVAPDPSTLSTDAEGRLSYVVVVGSQLCSTLCKNFIGVSQEIIRYHRNLTRIAPEIHKNLTR